MFSKKVQLTFFLSSLLALASVYLLQFVFGIIPCKLCLYERIPYFVVMMLSLFSLLRTYKIVIYIMFFSYSVGAIISFYHVGLELHWFSDILSCARKFDTLSFDAIKGSLLDSSYVATCDRPHILLGLSIAQWNLIYSVFWLIINLFLYNAYENQQLKK
ncbi:disulfide bond formation protein B [Candidatus Mesenet endosymbiont of Phosphuga atrata]|uniref:disulfide bond formation protein B n=1 Tax=Candidatus Mesenet endosymbiont of Phosphuga atrata TaxID=3066221 RepID=UPI0030D421F9